MPHDQLFKFMFEHTAVRGEVVSIQTAWQQIVSLHDFPKPVLQLLGEMVAASTLLSSTLKFDGALIMQIFGDGPVKLLVVECHADLGLRATAKVAPSAVIDDDATMQALVNPHGQARMMITLDPRDKHPGQQPYQGIVPVEGDDIAAVLESYMARSAQIETRLWLACDHTSLGGLLLQRLPSEGGTQSSEPVPPTELHHAAMAQDVWQHFATLAETVKPEELLNLAPQNTVKRLFWQEDIRLFESRAPHFSCTCSREKVANMLLMLGQPEVESVLAEIGSVRVNCEYCNALYPFDAVDIAQLFTANNAAQGIGNAGSARH